jgi:chromosome segregation ATPase
MLPVSREKYDIAVKERDEAKSQLETVNGGLTELQSKVEASEKTIADQAAEIAALKEAATAKEGELKTAGETIATLEAKVTELGAAPGAETTKPKSATEAGNEKEEIDIAFFADKSISMREKVAKYRETFN